MAFRDWKAVDAWFRSSGGPMKDRRVPRGGSKNKTSDFFAEYLDELDPEDSQKILNSLGARNIKSWEDDEESSDDDFSEDFKLIVEDYLKNK